MAGLCVACRHGLENPDALQLAERTYVDVNIHQAEHADRLKQLEQLPDNCAASADCLQQQRAIYEEQGVFSSELVDGMIAHLRSFNDRTLRQEAEANPSLMRELVERYFHCG